MNRTVLTIIIIGLILLCLFSIRTCSNKNKEIDTISYNIKHLQDSTTHWVNRYGTIIAVNKELQGTIKELKVTNQRDIDSVTKHLQISDKHISGIQKVHIVTNTVFVDRVDTSHRGDTTSSFTHIQPHLSVTEVTIGDSAHVDIHDTVAITIAETWDRKWLLGNKIHKVSAFTDRSDVTITGINSITIKEQSHPINKFLYIGAGLAAGFFIFHK